MVCLKRFLLILVLLSGITVVQACDTVATTKDGYIVDCRGNYSNSPIKPPHPENIPSVSNTVQPVVDFEEYHKINEEGYRGREDKLPLIYGYTINGSSRSFTYYNKEDYINIWCDGQKHVGKIDCLTDEYAISFFPLSEWARGIAVAAWRARGRSQKGVAAFYVEDAGANAADLHQAKDWADLWRAKIMFISIDAGIPVDWVQ